jgi:hypothetical protein
MLRPAQRDGRWHGTVRVDGTELPIRSLIRWAEEFEDRW